MTAEVTRHTRATTTRRWLAGLIVSTTTIGMAFTTSSAPAEAETATTSVAVSVSRVAVGDGHTCALANTLTVWCWGRNDHGQLGRGATGAPSRQPALVPGLDEVLAIAAGARHTCAVRLDQSLWCWGDNDSGQLGDGSTTDRSTPTQVLGLPATTSVTAGDRHTCSAWSDRAWCWGANGSGQLGTAAAHDARFTFTESGAATMNLGIDSVALAPNGDTLLTDTQGQRVWRFTGDGRARFARPASGISNPGPITATATGVYVASVNTQFENPPGRIQRLDQDGNLVAQFPTLSAVAGLGCTSDACRIAGLAGVADGTVIAGVNRSGAFIDRVLVRYDANGTVQRQQQIWMDVEAPIADLALYDDDGLTRLAVVGTNLKVVIYAVPSTPTAAFTRVADFSVREPSRLDATCGRVDEFAKVGESPAQPGTFRWSHIVSTPTGVRLGASADGHLAVVTRFTILTRWTGGFYINQPADPDPTFDATYSTVSSVPSDYDCLDVYDTTSSPAGAYLETVIGDVAGGTSLRHPHDAAGRADGSHVLSDAGLGGVTARLVDVDANGTIDPAVGGVVFRSVPTEVEFLDSVVPPATVQAIAAGGDHTCLTTWTQGNGIPAACWGANGSGQIGPPDPLSFVQSTARTSDATTFPRILNSTPGIVVAGQEHSCATDGATARCWGSNQNGQTTVTVTDGQIVSSAAAKVPIAAGALFTCGLAPSPAQGSVRCWGESSEAQLGNSQPGACGDGVQLVRPDGCGSPITGVTELDAGRATACAVRDTGTLTCWGANEFGQAAPDSAAGVVGPTDLTLQRDLTIEMVAPADTGSLSPTYSLNFDPPVANVTADNVELVEVGQTTNLAAAPTCKIGAASTPCAGGSVTRASLKPKAPLVPGRRYQIRINDSGAASLVNSEGMDVPTTVLSLRASTLQEETSVAGTARWGSQTISGTYGNTVVAEHLAGATASYSFRGSSFALVTVTGPDQGTATVKIDDRPAFTIDGYASRRSVKQIRGATKLTPGEHTVTITVRGTKGNPKATDTFVTIDALRIGPTIVDAPALTHTWSRRTVAGASGGRVAQSDRPTAALELRFDGTRIDWVTLVGPDQGDAKVLIDGKLVGTVSNHQKTQALKTRSFKGLAPGPHRIRIVPTGTGPGSRDLVTVDRWIVR